MSKKNDPAESAHKVLAQINENLGRDGDDLRLVSINFIKRGDYTAAIVHALTLDPVKPVVVIGYGFSKRHPEDESDRSVGYEFAFKRAIDDVFHAHHKAQEKSAYYH